MKRAKRNLRWVITLYTLLAVVGTSIALVACKSIIEEANLYKFSEFKYDESPNYTNKQISELYEKGVTLKRFNYVDYFIENPNFEGKIDNIESIKFGPLTTVDSLNYQLKFSLVDPSTKNYRINVKIPLVSKLKGVINKTKFKISWVTFDSEMDKCQVVELTPVINVYVNGLNYDDLTTLNIFWETKSVNIKHIDVYLFIESINYTDSGDFREVMTFDMNRLNGI